MKKRYTVASLRSRLADALDEAESGQEVVIDRRGVRFRLTREAARAQASAKRAPQIEIVDPAIAGGQWSWNWTPDGLEFTSRKRR